MATPGVYSLIVPVISAPVFGSGLAGWAWTMAASIRAAAEIENLLIIVFRECFACRGSRGRVMPKRKWRIEDGRGQGGSALVLQRLGLRGDMGSVAQRVGDRCAEYMKRTRRLLPGVY